LVVIFTAKWSFVPAIGAVGRCVAKGCDKTATRSIRAAEVVWRASDIGVTLILSFTEEKEKSEFFDWVERSLFFLNKNF
jgi:hypothetical protein